MKVLLNNRRENGLVGGNSLPLRGNRQSGLQGPFHPGKKTRCKVQEGFQPWSKGCCNLRQRFEACLQSRCNFFCLSPAGERRKIPVQRNTLRFNMRCKLFCLFPLRVMLKNHQYRRRTRRRRHNRSQFVLTNTRATSNAIMEQFHTAIRIALLRPKRQIKNEEKPQK